MKNKLFIFSSSLVMAAVISFTTLISLLTPDFYDQETFNWQVQSLGQDGINLILVVPFLVITSFLQYKGHRKASPVWAGTMLYIAYTYAIYCFNIHFNILFIAYCFIFGSSFYAVSYFLYTQRSFNANPESNPARTIRVVTACYFLTNASLFFSLWLSDLILSTLQGRIPASIKEAGLYTNPVHVLDLSVVLPGVFMSGILLLKKKSPANSIIPVLLTFFILMNATITALTLIMFNNKISPDISVAIIMVFLAIISSILLTLNLKHRYV